MPIVLSVGCFFKRSSSIHEGKCYNEKEECGDYEDECDFAPQGILLLIIIIYLLFFFFTGFYYK
jgi:hypothetical protein